MSLFSFSLKASLRTVDMFYVRYFYTGDVTRQVKSPSHQNRQKFQAVFSQFEIIIPSSVLIALVLLRKTRTRWRDECDVQRKVASGGPGDKIPTLPLDQSLARWVATVEKHGLVNVILRLENRLTPNNESWKHKMVQCIMIVCTNWC